jgi:hypothetical protein
MPQFIYSFQQQALLEITLRDLPSGKELPALKADNITAL